MAISEPRNFLTSLSFAPNISKLFSLIEPERFTFPEVNNPIIALAVTLFPAPDSPTMPKFWI